MTKYIAQIDRTTEAFYLWVEHGLIVQLQMGERFVYLQPKDKQRFNASNFMWVKRVD